MDGTLLRVSDDEARDAAGVTLGRRELLGLIGVGLLGCAGHEVRLELEASPAPTPPALPPDLFRVGVASGDPLHDRVVIWTRLAPEPLRPAGGMPDVQVPVVWEVFLDERLQRPVRNGWVYARPELAHSVHVDVDGLEPNRTYWYRFRVGDELGPIGRTKTFPAPDSRPSQLRLAVACCQKYRDGFYTAHDHIAATPLDAVLFLGDYIYESGNEGDVPGRAPIDLERVTDLEGFRARYGGYRMDASLQAAHAAHPWIVTWDDHEVSNDYAGTWLDEPRRRDGEPLALRAAGYQAWYEHMPVRLSLPDDPAFFDIHRSFAFGDLATLYVLDGRQHRDPPPCEEKVAPPCEELLAGGLSLLGAAQVEWLIRALRGSHGAWNLVAQPVLFSPALLELNLANRDQWDGYLDDREAILATLAAPEVEGPMVLSGDVHAAGFFDLYRDQHDRRSERVALEVLTTSISSGGDGDPDDEFAPFAGLAERALRSVHYADAMRRGFTLLEYRRDGCTVTYHAVSTVRAPVAELQVAARFEVERRTLDHRLVERLR
ncbi:MAG: alkaline phosphatase D family protein [Myxococcales bacterium]|nr:alkaline phosphatase D family protein [Myxococcales bacterium]